MREAVFVLVSLLVTAVVDAQVPAAPPAAAPATPTAPPRTTTTRAQLERMARGTPFVLRRHGSGAIEDLATGERTILPLERRIHVVVAAEGYTRADLQAGAFDRELARWEREIFSVEPYSTFGEALVVWALPLASAERLAPGRETPGRTAFQMPLTADGWGVSRVPPSGPTAARLWAELERFPVPLTYFPRGGKLDRLARNLVVVLSLYDARYDEGGFSGRAITLADPLKADRRVATAIGIDRPHEFTHAFARLVDEYLDDDVGNLGVDNERTRTSFFLSNVVDNPRCDALPWKHLLPGGEINPHAHNLVGAFGARNRGYHPELKCLMNGRHHNARYYGGDGILRTMERLCNFCREVATFRLFERVGLLPDPMTSLDTWSRVHRRRFYERFGFHVPPLVPQANSRGQTYYQPCQP